MGQGGIRFLKIIRASIALLGAFLVLGCSEKASVNDSRDSAEPSQRKVVRVVFDLPGDDIGGQESQAILDAIRAGIAGRKAGEIISSGHGMGNMEIVVALESDESTGEIRKVIGDVYPEGRYRIEHRTR